MRAMTPLSGLSLPTFFLGDKALPLQPVDFLGSSAATGERRPEAKAYAGYPGRWPLVSREFLRGGVEKRDLGETARNQ